MEGKLFGNVSMNLELRLSVEDSPNSAAVAVDAIRFVKLALERGQGGVLYAPSAYLCKHPPRQYTDDEAYRMTEAFIENKLMEPPEPRSRLEKEKLHAAYRR
jgi:myo-inositol-1-phosphate synthase